MITQVAGGKVKYFVDGVQQVEHGGRFYPRSIMSINFNLWFIKDGAAKAQGARSYSEDIDWAFFEAKSALTPEQVEATVAALRRRSVKFRDVGRICFVCRLSFPGRERRRCVCHVHCGYR